MDQESGFAWTPIPGHNGTAATITAYASGLLTVGGLGGLITSDTVEHVITLGGAAQPGNIGTFQIVEFVDANTVVIADPNGVFPDANSGSITWQTSTINLQFPLTVGVPDDGDAWDAAEFAPGYLGLLQRTAQTAYQSLVEDSMTFLSSGTWVAPAGCEWVEVDGCGGGGGGEAGCAGRTSANIPAQGGGGGAAQRGSAQVNVTPGTEYVITIGAGGAGGTHNGGAGADGDSSTFGTASPWSIVFRGGRGCGAGPAQTFPAVPVPFSGPAVGAVIAPGAYGAADILAQRPWVFFDPGLTNLDFFPASFSATVIDNERFGVRVPGSGGACIASASLTDPGFLNFPGGASQRGMPSAGWHNTAALALYGSFLGGAPGNTGALSGGLGGPGGGGGGGGPFGPGANGGNGGAGASSGAAGAASNAADAADNTGAGGGGGGVGGGGSGASSGGHGGDGGAGGSGRVRLKFFRFATVTGPITTP